MSSSSTAVLPWALEHYIAVHDALTKGQGTVRPVSEIEEAFYKQTDLKHVLLLHGLTAHKPPRKELLQQLAGCRLTPPELPQTQPGAPVAAQATSAAGGGPALPPPSVSATDLAQLGWATVNDALMQSLQRPAYVKLPQLPTQEQLDEQQRQQEGGQQGGGQQQQAHAAGLQGQPPSRPAPGQAPAAKQAAPPEPPQQWQPAVIAPVTSDDETIPSCSQPDSQEGDAGGMEVSSEAAAAPTPPAFEHSPWLQQQMTAFGSQPDCGVSDEVLSEAQAAKLAGRRVAFLLLEDMRVQGAKGALLTLEAGLYQGRVVKHTGAACNAEFCEEACGGDHSFYQVKVIPPAGSSAGADGGRPVQLLLDLQPRLRCTAMEQLLWMEPEQLQDAWLLLQQKGPPVMPLMPPPRAALPSATKAAASSGVQFAAGSTKRHKSR